MPLLPTTTDNEVLTNDFEIIEDADQPTNTYYMNLDTKRVGRSVDGQRAMKQCIYKILQTERYWYKDIYSNNYGVELADLIGTTVNYAMPEIERRITEALTWDERITSVSDFSFTPQKNKVLVTFTANTIFGNIEINDFSVEI